MLRVDLELESISEHHGVCTEVIADSIAPETAIYGQCALVQPPPSALQLSNRRKNARRLTDLVAVFALLPHISGFALQVLDLARTWSDRGDDDMLQNFSPGTILMTLQLWMLATPTPVAWVEIFRRRLLLGQQQQLLQPPNLLAVPPTVLAGCAHHIAEAHVQSLPFSVDTTAS